MSEAVDLITCDKEPIHIPGSIQPHGCLLACDAAAQTLLRHSANAKDYLSLNQDTMLGQGLSDVLPGDVAHDLRNALGLSNDPRRPGVLLGYKFEGQGQAYDIAVHRFENHCIMEFERATEVSKGPLELARNLIARTQTLQTVEQMAREVPRFLQAMLDYDRVMIYRFAEDGSGKVIGEAKRAHLESFLGQHFPAADIPQQARTLYLKNTIRVISDASGQRSAIVPERDASGAALDLSYAHLRSVSPIHLEYLRNMGVAASMSVSVIVGGELWGMIACHHYSPKTLTMAQRIAAEMFGDFFSLHIAAADHRRRYQATLHARRTLDNLMAKFTFNDVIDPFLRAHLPEIGDLLPCDGAGLMLNGVWTSIGSTPPVSAVLNLIKNIHPDNASGIWASHSISKHFPNAAEYAAQAAGMLMVPLSKLPRDYLMFFRKEQEQTLNWAGDPNKSYQVGPHGDRLTPRKSFAIWKQSVQWQSLPWTEEELQISEAARVGLQDVILRQSEVLEDERKKAEVRQRVLNEELNHRVKNILALIKSLVSYKPEEKQGLEQYIENLQGRIMALSFAHDQVVRSGGGGSLAQLLRAELSPYPTDQVSLNGDDVELESRAFSVMALVVHELATNAAKYGALSVKEGQLVIAWGLSPEGDLDLTWNESGGPAVTPPSRKGFGTVLLTRSIPFDLGGTSQIDYAESGVKAQLRIPFKFVTKINLEVTGMDAAVDEKVAPRQLGAGKDVMLLEDQLLIALDVEEMLGAMGFQNVTTVSSVAHALRHLQMSPPDLAVLDVNLGSDTSIPVAEELQRRGIPFVFATGYGDGATIPEHLRQTAIVRKPYSEESLRAELSKTLRK